MSSTHDHDDDVDALLQDRMSEVRVEWKRHHGDVPISPATESDVSVILLLLAKHGVPPTVRAVREVIGAGSLSSLTPMVRAAWIRKELPQRMATLERGQAVPDRLLQFWDLLVTDATAKAKETLYRQSSALDERSAGLNGREEALMHKERLIDERVAGLLAQLASTQASERELRGSLADRTAELKTSRERLDEAQVAAVDATRTLGIREADLTAARRLAEAASERAAASEQHAETLRSRLAIEIERAQNLVVEKVRLEVELKSERDDARTSRERHLEASQAAQESKQELQRVRAELDQARSMLEALRIDFDRRGNDLLQHQSRVAALNAEATLREKAEVDLNRARDELQTVIHERDNLLRNPPALIGQLQRIHEALEKLLPRTSN